MTSLPAVKRTPVKRPPARASRHRITASGTERRMTVKSAVCAGVPPGDGRRNRRVSGHHAGGGADGRARAHPSLTSPNPKGPHFIEGDDLKTSPLAESPRRARRWWTCRASSPPATPTRPTPGYRRSASRSAPPDIYGAYGLQGPVQVSGAAFNGTMPAFDAGVTDRSVPRPQGAPEELPSRARIMRIRLPRLASGSPQRPPGSTNA
jgi:hypothetical protein